nr:hypothetical protein [Chloroflexota bacterium]
AFRLAPHAGRIDARRVEIRALAAGHIPVQLDGDAIGSRGTWSFEIRPAAVRLIGRWS